MTSRAGDGDGGPPSQREQLLVLIAEHLGECSDDELRVVNALIALTPFARRAIRELPCANIAASAARAESRAVPHGGNARRPAFRRGSPASAPQA